MRIITLLFCFMLSLLMGAQNITVSHLGTYATGSFDEGASEIVAYDPTTQRLFSTNAEDNSVDIIDFSDPTNMSLLQQIDLSSYGDGVNSVAVKDGLVAVAVQANPKTDSGHVVLFNTNGVFQAQFTVGALPDMVTFSPNGAMILSANEGEPNADYSVDPNGSVSIISLDQANLAASTVITLDFSSFTTTTIDPNVRLKVGATVAADLEPEYIAVNASSTQAFVTLQENNALASVDLVTKSIVDVIALGYKDHGQVGNKLDASDRSSNVDFQNFANLYGMYMPDAIAAIDIQGATYYVTANEGDGREYDTYEDEIRVKDLLLDSIVFQNAAYLQVDTVLGRLTVSAVDGDTDNDGDMDELYVFGGRSFSIWNNQGLLVYDSGDQIEQQVNADFPLYFNATNDDNDSFKNRSDNKGPEPEAVCAFTIGNIHFAAIGLERIGGFMLYDITNPNAPIFLNYTNNRNFMVDADSSAAGDLGPEDIKFIPASNSPNGQNLLVVSNEISGTVSAFALSGYGITIEENEWNGANAIYPNPTTDSIKLSKKGDYTLFDVTGRCVLSIKNANQISLKHLPAGTYFLKDASGHSQKLIKH